MLFFYFLSTVSAVIVSLENITLPITIVCNFDNCTISSFVVPSNDTVFSGTFTGFCNLDQDCPRLESCNIGVCGAPLLGCSLDFDCFEPDICLHGVCSSVEICTDVCVTNETMCIDGFCLLEPNQSTETATETATEIATETATEIATEIATGGYYKYMKDYLNIA
jgi:hypothetical protein